MAGSLTLQERDQLAARYECWHSVVRIQRCWRTIHGPRAQVSPKPFKNCHSKLMTTGSVADARRCGRPSTIKAPETVQAVQEIFTLSPRKSTRQAARESQLTRYTVRTVLKKELRWRAWMPHYCQSLSDEDCDIRMEFGEIMLAWHEEWPHLFRNILWSGEAAFHVGGFANRHNCHYWARDDPIVTAEKNADSPQCNGVVWLDFGTGCGSVPSAQHRLCIKHNFYHFKDQNKICFTIIGQ
jgi:hypothetical protein